MVKHKHLNEKLIYSSIEFNKYLMREITLRKHLKFRKTNLEKRRLYILLTYNNT